MTSRTCHDNYYMGSAMAQLAAEKGSTVSALATGITDRSERNTRTSDPGEFFLLVVFVA